MDITAIARATAYEHLGRWVDKYKIEYGLNQKNTDRLMVDFLKSEEGEARFATPVELQAISILEEVLIIEDSRETGAAYDVLEGEAEDLQTILIRLLSKKISTLEKLLSGGISSVISLDKEKTTKRDSQLNVIIEQIKKLEYEPHSIPTGGKAKILNNCLMHSPKLFTESGFNHAWNVGLKRGMFRMIDHEKYSKGMH